MTETQKRIEAYQKVLPDIKEKVIAVAMLLALSVIMLTSASFAWLTISRAPEVTQVATNVAANGNLEIALATGNGTEEPGESQVGDSSATKGQSITAANITWGNLVNLNDPSYGLDHLVLRPAQLNPNSLLESPLYGAVYDEDGRITQLTSNFGYTAWTKVNETELFALSDKVGVRAISSVKSEIVEDDSGFGKMYAEYQELENINLQAKNEYTSLSNNKDTMQSLATMMGLFMTSKMNPDEESLHNPTVEVKDIGNLAELYKGFASCMETEADAIAALLNFNLKWVKKVENPITYTGEQILGMPESELKTLSSIIGSTSTKSDLKNDLVQFVKDYKTILADGKKLSDTAENGGTIKWMNMDISSIVSRLVNVNKCTVGGTPISSIGASNAMSYLGGTQEARITNGILYRFEERTGGQLIVKDLSISAKVKRMGITIPATVKANVQTSFEHGNVSDIFTTDRENQYNQVDIEGTPVESAQDTYGLAVDLWVRTNAAGSYLTLEGNILSEKRQQEAKGKDSEGNEVDIYTVTRTTTDEETGETLSATYDLYEVTNEDGTKSWNNAETHTLFELGENETPIKKMIEVVIITGYEGENRVWDKDASLLSTDATTQGNGSCYIYYADTPEDQAQSLELLKSMKVAFVDGSAKLLATASMDTEHFFAESGRVIVPLVLDSDSEKISDMSGEETYVITSLEKNTPTRITAIVYLDGMNLTNDKVLAAADIQGQLNIQLGSNNEMKPADDEDLQQKTRTVSAKVDKTSFDFGKDEKMEVTVTVKVDGDQPTNMTGFFLREINATQGSREDSMTFEDIDDDGTWEAKYKFTAPGNYVLRTVKLDGQEYYLSAPQPRVEISGFAVDSLTYVTIGGKGSVNGNNYSYMSADSYGAVGLKLKFASSETSAMPNSVQGRFLFDGGTVNVNFTYNPTDASWNGTANFLTSGNYTMQYIVVDGQYMELPSGCWKYADITLGMRVAVYTTSPHKFKYSNTPGEMAENEEILDMQVRIFDNAGEELVGLQDVGLRYGLKGSAVGFMDADLEWNGSYYVGGMQNGGMGVWDFGYVSVGSNTISNATSAPTFTIMASDPPEFYSNATDEIQVKPNNDATFVVNITNAPTAQGKAKVVRIGSNGKEGENEWAAFKGLSSLTVDGRIVNQITFNLPANEPQDGTWKLKEIYLWEVMKPDGSIYTENDPLVIKIEELHDEEYNPIDIRTTVTTSVVPTFGEEQKFVEFEGRNFLEAYTLSKDEFAVSFIDAFGNLYTGEGENAAKVENVVLTLKWMGDSKTFGGYGSANLSAGTVNVPIEFTDNGDGTFSQTNNEVFTYAGTYEAVKLEYTFGESKFTYGDADGNGKVENSEKTLPNNVPKVTVSTERPTVTVTGVSPTTIKRYYSVATPTNTSQIIEGNFSKKIDDYTALAYIYYDYQSGLMDQEYYRPVMPTVTLKIENMPATYSATMLFKNDTDSAYNKTFTFTSSNPSNTQSIGYGTTGSADWSGNVSIPLYPAGKQTVDEISVVYNNITFTVELSHAVTINQPQCPIYVDFGNIYNTDATFNGTQPLREYSTDGETVTLPSTPNTWTYQVGVPLNELVYSDYALVETIGKYYYERGCDDTPHYHHNKYQRTGTVSSELYNVTKGIQWLINGVLYNPGDVIEISDFAIATPVITQLSREYIGTKVLTYTETSEMYIEVDRGYGYTQIEEAPECNVRFNVAENVKEAIN